MLHFAVRELCGDMPRKLISLCERVRPTRVSQLRAHYMYGTRGAVKRGGPVLTDAEPTLLGTPEMLDAGFRCRQCQQLKVRCDRAFPCARCFERGVSCRPPLEVGDPSCDLVLSKANPAGMAERYFKVVQDMIENNQLDRGRVIRLCKAWKGVSAREGCDISYSIVDRLCTLVGIEAEDHGAEAGGSHREEGERMHCMVESEGDAQKQGEEEEASTDMPARLVGSKTFKLMDDGVSGLFVELPMGDDLVLGINAKGGELLWSAHEYLDLLREHKMLPLLMVSSVCGPDDRGHLFLAHIIGQLGITTTAHTALIRLFIRTGEMGLYILKTRGVVFPEFGGVKCLVMWLEKAPSSRYVTERPNHPHRVIQAFRQLGEEGDKENSSQPGAEVDAAATGGEGRNVRVPGMACLPVNPLSTDETTTLLGVTDWPYRAEQKEGVTEDPEQLPASSQGTQRRIEPRRDREGSLPGVQQERQQRQQQQTQQQQQQQLPQQQLQQLQHRLDEEMLEVDVEEEAQAAAVGGAAGGGTDSVDSPSALWPDGNVPVLDDQILQSLLEDELRRPRST